MQADRRGAACAPRRRTPRTISPDGRWVLTIPLFGSPRIVAVPTGAGAPRTLGLGFARHAWAGWFPDSRRVVFTAAEAGQPMRAYVQDLEGGPTRPVTGEVGMGPSFVTPDSQRLLVRTPGAAGQWQLHPLAGGAPQPAPSTFDRPSPHSRWPRPRVALVGDGSHLVERADVATGARRLDRGPRGGLSGLRAHVRS